MGLGCGGHSRIGKSTGRSRAESVALIRAAVDAGVTFIDTAESYQTEELVGEAIRGMDRSRLVISTKKSVTDELGADELRHGLDESLRKLGTERVDVYHLHGVTPEQYPGCAARLVPALEELRRAGKVGFVGITEHFGSDTSHRMLEMALRDDCWDVVMVGHNLLNQSARRSILPLAVERNVGVLVMFAVRRALSDPARLREVVDELLRHGTLRSSDIDPADPLGFLVHDGGGASLTDAAYRFCRDEPGVHVVLSGTGDLDHLRENLRSFARPALPPEDTRRARSLFAGVDTVSGN
jgi:L-galactose dehydrogenase